MAHLQLVKQTSSGLLLPATPESGDFLRSVKIGEWIHADFKRVRNYAFHKRFFKLLQLGFDYWTPTGGTVTSREQKLISGFVNFLCDSAGQEYTPALNEAAEQYLHNVATLRTGDDRAAFRNKYSGQLSMNGIIHQSEIQLKNLRKQRDEVYSDPTLTARQQADRVLMIEQNMKKVVDSFNQEYREMTGE